MWMKHLFQNVEDYKKVRLYLLTVMVVIIIIIMCCICLFMSVHVNTKHLTMHTDLMLEKRKKKVICIYWSNY